MRRKDCQCQIGRDKQHSIESLLFFTIHTRSLFLLLQMRMVAKSLYPSWRTSTCWLDTRFRTSCPFSDFIKEVWFNGGFAGELHIKQWRVNTLNKFVSSIYEGSIVSLSHHQVLSHSALSTSRLTPTHSQTSVSTHDDSNDSNDLPLIHLLHNQSTLYHNIYYTHFKWRRNLFTISITLFYHILILILTLKKDFVSQ